jgi:hypothetical protein
LTIRVKLLTQCAEAFFLRVDLKERDAADFVQRALQPQTKYAVLKRPVALPAPDVAGRAAQYPNRGGSGGSQTATLQSDLIGSNRSVCQGMLIHKTACSVRVQCQRTGFGIVIIPKIYPTLETARSNRHAMSRAWVARVLLVEVILMWPLLGDAPGERLPDRAAVAKSARLCWSSTLMKASRASSKIELN